jgi:uncharacterized repeat protein (TIGR01451 family)
MYRTATTAMLMAGSAAILTAAPSLAQTATTGTPVGTIVNNTAQASYTVNGAAQTTMSNTATFVVDRKVNLTVTTAQAANTQVNLGQTAAVTKFTVTNNTNGTQDFLLSADQNIGTIVFVGTDDFDMSNLRAFVDDGDGIYDPNVDKATYIDELAPDATATVFVVGDLPSTSPGTTNLAIVSLNATVATGGTPGSQGVQGTPLIATDLNLLNQAATVDVVFADGDSDGIGADILRNGQGRAYAAYEVSVRNVALTVQKSASVLSDGFSIIPKAIPGAVVQYCLTVANATLLTPASNVNLTDIVPPNTTYVPGSLTIGGIGTGGVCLVNGFPQNDDGSNTVGPYRGSYNAVNRTITATIPTLLGGTSLAASFRVTIN